jgi:hypothetical protein
MGVYIPYSTDWFEKNEARAQAAMKAAGIWYRHPHVPPYEPVIEEPPPPEPEPEPDPLFITKIPFSPWPTVLKAVAHVTGIPMKMILVGRNRRVPVVAARHVAAIILTGMGFSRSRIGRILHRDHSTVLAAIRGAAKHQDAVDKVKALLGCAQ